MIEAILHILIGLLYQVEKQLTSVALLSVTLTQDRTFGRVITSYCRPPRPLFHRSSSLLDSEDFHQTLPKEQVSALPAYLSGS